MCNVTQEEQDKLRRFNGNSLRFVIAVFLKKAILVIFFLSLANKSLALTVSFYEAVMVGPVTRNCTATQMQAMCTSRVIFQAHAFLMMACVAVALVGTAQEGAKVVIQRCDELMRLDLSNMTDVIHTVTIAVLDGNSSCSATIRLRSSHAFQTRFLLATNTSMLSLDIIYDAAVSAAAAAAAGSSTPPNTTHSACPIGGVQIATNTKHNWLSIHATAKTSDPLWFGNCTWLRVEAGVVLQSSNVTLSNATIFTSTAILSLQGHVVNGTFTLLNCNVTARNEGGIPSEARFVVLLKDGPWIVEDSAFVMKYVQAREGFKCIAFRPPMTTMCACTRILRARVIIAESTISGMISGVSEDSMIEAQASLPSDVAVVICNSTLLSPRSTRPVVLVSIWNQPLKFRMSIENSTVACVYLLVASATTTDVEVAVVSSVVNISAQLADPGWAPILLEHAQSSSRVVVTFDRTQVTWSAFRSAETLSGARLIRCASSASSPTVQSDVVIAFTLCVLNVTLLSDLVRNAWNEILPFLPVAVVSVENLLLVSVSLSRTTVLLSGNGSLRIFETAHCPSCASQLQVHNGTRISCESLLFVEMFHVSLASGTSDVSGALTVSVRDFQGEGPSSFTVVRVPPKDQHQIAAVFINIVNCVWAEHLEPVYAHSSCSGCNVTLVEAYTLQSYNTTVVISNATVFSTGGVVMAARPMVRLTAALYYTSIVLEHIVVGPVTVDSSITSSSPIACLLLWLSTGAIHIFAPLVSFSLVVRNVKYSAVHSTANTSLAVFNSPTSSSIGAVSTAYFLNLDLGGATFLLTSTQPLMWSSITAMCVYRGWRVVGSQLSFFDVSANVSTSQVSLAVKDCDRCAVTSCAHLQAYGTTGGCRVLNITGAAMENCDAQVPLNGTFTILLSVNTSNLTLRLIGAASSSVIDFTKLMQRHPPIRDEGIVTLAPSTHHTSLTMRFSLQQPVLLGPRGPTFLSLQHECVALTLTLVVEHADVRELHQPIVTIQSHASLSKSSIVLSDSQLSVHAYMSTGDDVPALFGGSDLHMENTSIVMKRITSSAVVLRFNSDPDIARSSALNLTIDISNCTFRGTDSHHLNLVAFASFRAIAAQLVVRSASVVNCSTLVSLTSIVAMIHLVVTDSALSLSQSLLDVTVNSHATVLSCRIWKSFIAVRHRLDCYPTEGIVRLSSPSTAHEVTLNLTLHSTTVDWQLMPVRYPAFVSAAIVSPTSSVQQRSIRLNVSISHSNVSVTMASLRQCESESGPATPVSFLKMMSSSDDFPEFPSFVASAHYFMNNTNFFFSGCGTFHVVTVQKLVVKTLSIEWHRVSMYLCGGLDCNAVAKVLFIDRSRYARHPLNVSANITVCLSDCVIYAAQSTNVAVMHVLPHAGTSLVTALAAALLPVVGVSLLRLSILELLCSPDATTVAASPVVVEIVDTLFLPAFIVARVHDFRCGISNVRLRKLAAVSSAGNSTVVICNATFFGESNASVLVASSPNRLFVPDHNGSCSMTAHVMNIFSSSSGYRLISVRTQPTATAFTVHVDVDDVAIRQLSTSYDDDNDASADATCLVCIQFLTASKAFVGIKLNHVAWDARSSMVSGSSQFAVVMIFTNETSRGKPIDMWLKLSASDVAVNTPHTIPLLLAFRGNDALPTQRTDFFLFCFVVNGVDVSTSREAIMHPFKNATDVFTFDVSPCSTVSAMSRTESSWWSSSTATTSQVTSSTLTVSLSQRVSYTRTPSLSPSNTSNCSMSRTVLSSMSASSAVDNVPAETVLSAVAAAVSSAGAISSAIGSLVSGSVSLDGGALAAVSSVECVDTVDKRAASPLRFLLSPFADKGGAAMVVGNIGIVLAVFCIHTLLAVATVCFSSKHPREILAHHWFPQATLGVAVFLAPGAARGAVSVMAAGVWGPLELLGCCFVLPSAMCGFAFVWRRCCRWVHDNASYGPLRSDATVALRRALGTVVCAVTAPVGEWTPASGVRRFGCVFAAVQGQEHVRFLWQYLVYNSAVSMLSAVPFPLQLCYVQMMLLTVAFVCLATYCAIRKPYRSPLVNAITGFSFLCVAAVSLVLGLNTITPFPSTADTIVMILSMLQSCGMVLRLVHAALLAHFNVSESAAVDSRNQDSSKFAGTASMSSRMHEMVCSVFSSPSVSKEKARKRPGKVDGIHSQVCEEEDPEKYHQQHDQQQQRNFQQQKNLYLLVHAIASERRSCVLEGKKASRVMRVILM